MPFMGEITESAKLQVDWRIRANLREGVANSLELCVCRFADEFQGHVKILRAHPAATLVSEPQRQIAKILEECREIVSYGGGNLQRNEQAHTQARFADCLPL